MSVVDGPWFDDLAVGDTFTAPAVTLDAGLHAQHRAILGDRLRLCLDETLAERVTGRPGLAYPGVVWDVAVGQSSVVTRQVVANLFYRGLRPRATPYLGDTLVTSTEVVALRRVRSRPDRPERGKAVLSIVTRDQTGRVILAFDRCALLPCRDGSGPAPEAGPTSTAFSPHRPCRTWRRPPTGSRSGRSSRWRPRPAVRLRLATPSS